MVSQDSVMPSQVNIHEAKTHFSSLVDRALRGEEIIIAKGGKPVAKLVPLLPPAPRQPGLLHGIFDERFFEPLPEEELAALEE
jgi:prevent-host-death family protein